MKYIKKLKMINHINNISINLIHMEIYLMDHQVMIQMIIVMQYLNLVN